MMFLIVHNCELAKLIIQLPMIWYMTLAVMTPTSLHVIDNNDGIKLHVPPSNMKRCLVVLCNTAVGPRGIL